MPNKLFQFWQELKRRRVIHVIVVYATAAFVILEAVDIIFPRLNFPDWTVTFVMILLAVGFPIALIFSWIFDVTPEGLEKTKPSQEIPKEARSRTPNSWRIATYISVVIIIGLIAFNIFGSRRGARINDSLEKSIAVLPFLNLSGDPGQDYICEGLTGEIINNLYKIESLNRVPSLTSVLNYRNSNKNIVEIADELQVNYILECQYKKLSDQLRFSTLLIEPGSGKHIWQHDFDRPMAELSAIPSDIALEIAVQLEAVITNPEKENIRKVYTTNPEAYELYHLADFYKRNNRDKKGLASSIILLKEAIDLDPEFALAYTSLAESYLLQYWFKFEQSGDLITKAREAIESALKINPGLAEGYIALANYYYIGFLDYTKALDQLDQASELMSDHTRIDFRTAVIYRRMGKWEEALERFEMALEKDPRSQVFIYNLSETYFCLGRYQEALEQVKTVRSIEPGSIISYEIEMFTYLLRDGNTVKAKEVLIEAARLGIGHEVLENALYLNPVSIYLYDEDFQGALDFLDSEVWEGEFSILYYYPKSLLQGWICDLMGYSERADAYYSSARMKLDSLIGIYPEDPRYSGAMGVACAGLGDKVNAIGHGKKAVELRSLEKDAFFGLTRIEELAWMYVMVEEYDAALEQIEILLSHPGPHSAPLLKLDPKWKPLWDHPEFIRLTEKYAVKSDILNGR